MRDYQKYLKILLIFLDCHSFFGLIFLHHSNSKALGKPVHQDQSNETPNFVNYYGEQKSIQKMNNSLEKSIESLNIFGNHAKNLVLLADYIVKRNH